MNEEWRNEIVTKGAVCEAIGDAMLPYIPRLIGRLEEIPLECTMALVKTPPAQKERMRGRWVPVTNGRGGFECDQCHNYAPSYQDGVEWLSDFCPNCGSDNRGEEDAVD